MAQCGGGGGGGGDHINDYAENNEETVRVPFSAQSDTFRYFFFLSRGLIIAEVPTSMF